MAWTPLESNPEVMNKFMINLGVPSTWQIVDVLSLDPDMLGMIPQPTLALILLFPTSEKYEKLREEEDLKIKEKGQTISPEVFFVKQYISNACGTIALIHSLANNLDQIKLEDGFLKKFIEDTKNLTPDERGNVLQEHEGFSEAHNTIAIEGQSEVPHTPVIHHFVAFVHIDGCLYELDGRKSFPINHGPTTPESYVADAAKVMTEIMKKDPDEIGFTVCALASEL